MIRYKAIAIRHLRAIQRYIAQDNPTAAMRVVSEIEAAVADLLDFPRAHRIAGRRGARELIIPGLPYIVVYRIGREHIDILGVFHAARHPAVRSRP